MLWALGEPISVMGKVGSVKFKNIEVEDVGFGIVEFKNGVYAQINNSMVIKPPLSILKDKVELQVFGKKGRVTKKKHFKSLITKKKTFYVSNKREKH